MPDAPRTRTGRRLLVVALYLGCLAAAAAAVHPLVAGASARPVPVPLEPGDGSEPLDPVPLPPGSWVLAAPDPRAGEPARERARRALGVGTTPELDPAAVPVPPGAVVGAVRVDPDGRPCGALTGPTDLGAARAAWAAAGWRVADHEFGRDLRALRLTRGGAAATAWVLPRGPLAQLLITAAPRGADVHGGSNP